MPIRSRRNQYRGVNAHLHSVLQNDGGWDSFHSNYISDLAEAIDGQLPSGYLVVIKQSLQIRENHPVEKLGIDEESFCPSVVIYQQQNDNLFGKPVTRLEVLSSTNKVSGQGYAPYKKKKNFSVGKWTEAG